MVNLIPGPRRQNQMKRQRWRIPARRALVVSGVLACALLGSALPAEADVFWGVDSCSQGYVWREATPADHVCVPPATRDQTWADNAAAPGRWVNGPFGPHTCVQGFVWREAVARDDVCVTPAVRTQAAQDNAAAAGRVASADEYHCSSVTGLPGDTFCVKLDHDIFGNYNSIRTRYRHAGAVVNLVQAGVLWNTNRGASGTFPSRLLNAGGDWETHAWLTNATVGTCATATVFISAPPNDPNGRFFAATADVCRRR
jgi:hypothetical protein